MLGGGLEQIGWSLPHYRPLVDKPTPKRERRPKKHSAEQGWEGRSESPRGKAGSICPGLLQHTVLPMIRALIAFQLEAEASRHGVVLK